LSKQQFEKLFSPDETNSLIPRLELIVRELQGAASGLRARVAKLAEGDQSVLGAELPELIERFPELRGFAARMSEAAGRIESMGGVLKDIDQGLVDFPCEVGGEVVFLCWQSGEPRVIAWHTTDSGFSERQPLPGVAKPLMN